MQLSDRDLRQLAPRLQLGTGDPKYPFEPDLQIQPCSIDLRVDRVFWRQRRRRSIDLRSSLVEELAPRRHWRLIELREDEDIILAPRELVLGRTAERMQMPLDHCGMVSGRSSLARVGLMVHCGAGLVQPGWQGRLPLQLFNISNVPMRLAPFLPICQLSISRLTSASDKPYDSQGLSSKYMDDDGGPSYWWRDRAVRRLEKTFAERELPPSSIEVFEEMSGRLDIRILERFEQFVGRLSRSSFGNIHEMIDAFAAVEESRRTVIKLARAVVIGIAPTLIACSIGSLFSQPFGAVKYSWLHWLLWCGAALSVPLSIGAYGYDTGEYLTAEKVEEWRSRNERGAEITKPEGVAGHLR